MSPLLRFSGTGDRVMSFTKNIEASKAAMAVGVAFIASIVLVTLVDDFLLANFVVPGDTEVLAREIAADRHKLSLAAAGYLFVLALDTVIGLALYIVLKPASRVLAWLTAAFRLSYVVVLSIGVFALVFDLVDARDYAAIKLFGYVLFALHLVFLGYTVFRSEYMPRSLGALLVVAALTYAVFFVELDLPEVAEILAMLTMLLAELSLSLWLIVRRNTLPSSTNG
ncbi:MAG: DUF4386 domain-containing protein [Myxococcales bacterium FL481]|nr:MAG: DUF4386 domain-containing protein [Myxococcales bacterium FL481]